MDRINRLVNSEARQLQNARNAMNAGFIVNTGTTTEEHDNGDGTITISATKQKTMVTRALLLRHVPDALDIMDACANADNVESRDFLVYLASKANRAQCRKALRARQ